MRPLFHNHRSANDGYNEAMGATEGPQAPGDLELVRSFVNSLDLETGRDRLGTPDDLDAWAHHNGLMAARATGPELTRVVELREAVRSALLAHHDRTARSDRALEVINSSMQWGAVRPILSVDGLLWVSATTGVSGLVGRLMTVVSTAAADGTWPRLKACSNDTCRWAFYDYSRSRTGRWCSMQVCGNRAKQQKFQRSH